MQEFQLRVVIEKAELDIKISKLASFIDSGSFEMVNNDEQRRLQNQLSAMTVYSNILHDRIKNFPGA